MQAAADLLQALLKIGGVTALTIGVFYLLYRQLLAMRIFARLGANQTFFFAGGEKVAG